MPTRGFRRSLGTGKSLSFSNEQLSKLFLRKFLLALNRHLDSLLRRNWAAYLFSEAIYATSWIHATSYIPFSNPSNVRERTAHAQFGFPPVSARAIMSVYVSS
jgi:hypothetical protein